MKPQTATPSQQSDVTFSYGVNVANANNLQPVAVGEADLYDWVVQHTTHVSRLHPNVHSQADFWALEGALRKRIKVRGPYIVPALFSGTHRALAEATHVTTAMIDLDTGNLSALEVRERVAGDLALIYNTPSSLPEDLRWRVVLPLARPVPVALYPQLVTAYCTARGFADHDSSSERAVQAMMLPVLFDDFAPHIEVLPGTRVDLMAFGVAQPVSAPPLRPTAPLGDDESARLFENYQPPAGYSLDTLRELISRTLADERGWWRTVGMAIHHETGGSPEGFALWDAWSQTCPEKYDAAVCAREWEAFRVAKPDRAPVTVRSIKHRLPDERARASVKMRKDLEADILLADESALRGSLAKRIRDNPVVLDPSDYAALATTIRNRLRDLAKGAVKAGLPASAVPPVSDVRDWITPNSAKRKAREREAARHKAAPRAADDGDGWLADWVYLQNGNWFFNTRTGEQMNRDAFNATHTRFMDRDDRGRPRFQAAEYALSLAPVPLRTVYDRIYLPGAPLFCVNPVSGRECVNTWRSNASPEPVPEFAWTADDEAVVRMWEGHLDLLLKPSDRTIVLDFLAWVTQHPGDRVLWAPLIQGPHGAGKSALAELMRAVLGPTNVGSVRPTDMQSQFSSWSAGALLKTVEEVHFAAAGAASWAIVNNIKPYITNPVITVRQMRADPYDMPNTASYLLFTNHVNALPLESGERRYCPIMTRARSKADVALITARDRDYFVRLFDSLRTHAGVLREWLLQHPISPSFPAKGNAPITDALEIMRLASAPDADIAIADLVNRLGEPALMSSRVVTDMLRREGIDARTTHVARVLRECGYELWCGGNIRGQLRVGMERHTVWARSNVLTPAQSTVRAVRATIEAQMQAVLFADPGAGQEDEDEDDDPGF